jgi:hypothetical protein
MNRIWWGSCAVFLCFSVGLAVCGGGDDAGDAVVADPGEPDIPAADVSYDTGDATVERDVPPEDVLPDEGQFPVDVPPQPGQFGYPCIDGTQCNSGFCVDTPRGSVCTTTCVQNCPDEWVCKTTSIAGDPISICVPLFLNLCDPCEETKDCNGDLTGGLSQCIDRGTDGKFCGGDCSIDGHCPAGYECRDVPAGGGTVAHQCMPLEDAECTCSTRAISLGLSTTCFVQNEVGTCLGERRCMLQGLSSCNARTPRTEICNGLDDDCNGLTDELQGQFPCERTNAYGTCTGTGDCISGSIANCNAPEPDIETCNGKDDNCNGQIDEGLCYDGNDCTQDLCDSNSGECIFIPIQGPCDDLNPCTVNDRCDSQAVCQPGVAKNCDDGNPCTDDSCDPGTGECIRIFNNAPCEDGNFCTENDYCLNGACRSGNVKSCLDDNPCTLNEACNPATGACTWTPNDGATCDDADPCTINDVCSGGQCIGPNDYCEGTICTPVPPQVACLYTCVIIPFVEQPSCPCGCL